MIYASPAFHTQQEFWENVLKGTIIDNSNYCEAINLSGHKKYTYVNGGTVGKAFSEPEEIENLHLREIIGNLRERGRDENNMSIIVNLASWIENAIEGSSYGKYYFAIIKSSKFFRESRYKEYRILYSLIKLSLFERVSGVKIMYGF